MQVPNDELNKAIEMWLFVQSVEPAWIADYINKRGNPFTPWPPEKEAVDAFVRQVTDKLFHGVEAKVMDKAIDPKKREELVREFNEEYDKVKKAQTAAEVAAKKRVQDVIKHTLEEPNVPPEQKPLLFQALEAKSQNEPQKTVAELVPEAIATGEVAQAFLNPKAGVEASGPTSFQKLRGLDTVQKNLAAAGVDALTTVFPDLRRGAFDRMVGDSLQKMLANTDFLTKKFGSDFLAQPWFTLVQRDAGRMVGQGAAHGGARNALEDVIASLFRGPADQTTLHIMEVYRINAMQGLPPPNFNQLRAAHMGIGSEIFKYGAEKAGRWAIGKGLTKLGIKAAAGTAGGPIGWGALAFDFLAGKLGQFGSWLKNLIFGGGKVPGDEWVLGIGCGAFLLIFLLFIVMQDINTNSSLRLRLSLGGEPEVSLPVYPGAPPIPSNIEGCPTKSAYHLTQCPAGTYSHERLWAYDIGIPMGVPIYATHDGVVAVVASESKSGGYGNMVELKGVTPEGKTYFTLYGHFSHSTVMPGQQVFAGKTIIGYADNTGHSSGSHLHYEYRGENNAASPSYGVDFLPGACVTNPSVCNLK